MRRVLCAIALFAAAAIGGRAQAPIAVRGRVTAASGDALRGARVSLDGATSIPAVLTDDDGAFRFEPVPDGRHTLAATKPGFAKTSQATNGAANVVLALQRGAVISGTVVDETGEPAAGVSVMIGSPPVGDGRPQATIITTSDDTGQFRAGGLGAGTYLVWVFEAAMNIHAVPGGGLMASGPGSPDRLVFYPAVPAASRAQPIALGPGDERGAVDFTIEAALPGERDAAATRAGKTDAVISGTVTRADGHPLSGAIARLAPVDPDVGSPRLAYTDSSGAFRFVVPEAAAGAYRLFAFKPGYVPKGFGQTQPAEPGTEIVAVPGKTFEDANVALSRAGVIGGRVFDDHGDPVEGAVMRALQLRYADGRRRLDALPMTGRSDDLGRYRIANLQPGQYVISASVGQVNVLEQATDLPGYGTTYFPGTPDTAGAQFVRVRGADESLGTSFALARIQTARVSGRALDASGEPITGGLQLIASRRSGAIVAAPLGARIERDGRFEFPGVAPGEYVLQASRHRGSGWDEGESFSQFVAVAGDVVDLLVRTAAGSTASGAVVFEGGGTLVPGQLEVSAIPVDADLSPTIGGPPARAIVDEDLEFTLAGLRGPRRIVLTRTPPGWALKSVTLHGEDVTDAPIPFGRADESIRGLEVVLTAQPTIVAGRVTASGRARPNALVLIFGADRSTWYPRSRRFVRTSSDRDGAFSVTGLPPGDYYALALTVTPGTPSGDDWQDPEYLDAQTSRATRLTLTDGARLSVTLTADR
jgi:hypothetical protein